MDMSKEDFNGVYATIFESVGEDIAREIHSNCIGDTISRP